MNCREVEKVVPSLLSQRGADPSSEIAGHMRTCRACTSRFAPLLTIASNLQHLPDKDLPEGFDVRFRHRMAGRTQREGMTAWQSVLFTIAANDEIRWILVLILGMGPIAVALGDPAAAPRLPLQVSTSNIVVMALGLMLAAVVVHTVFYPDLIMGIFRRKTR